MMKKLKDTLFAFAVGTFAMSSLVISASDQEPKMVMIQVNKSNDENAVVDLEIDGNVEAFDLPELQVGESKSITTQSGNNVLVTKTEEGLTVDVDGKTIKLPSFSGNLGARIHGSSAIHQIHKDTVQISGVKLDETQKQIIKDAFKAAGIEKELSFNEHSIQLVNVTDGFQFVTGDKEFEWHSNGDSNIEVIVEGDGSENVEKIIKKHIKVKKKED
ncbi:hypothetical protein FLL45_05880 [Aliikangiella marina]|uniref:Uncharacterized protein n=1 Tax=Aliikangiella marina TaxID=1712262 RepID=A0A545TJR1_9GAMM|nr:hypothetical protein [Aliikangiella marina]TQV77470.1 hypothetical protein FLL45_05880 [Aliikangiella marina]